MDGLLGGLKIGGEDFFRQIFPKTRPRYPVNSDRSLIKIWGGGGAIFGYDFLCKSKYPISYTKKKMEWNLGGFKIGNLLY